MEIKPTPVIKGKDLWLAKQLYHESVQTEVPQPDRKLNFPETEAITTDLNQISIPDTLPDIRYLFEEEPEILPAEQSITLIQSSDANQEAVNEAVSRVSVKKYSKKSEATRSQEPKQELYHQKTVNCRAGVATRGQARTLRTKNCEQSGEWGKHQGIQKNQ